MVTSVTTVNTPTAGVLHLFYGTVAGLGATHQRILHQSWAGMNETAEADDRFGWSLAAGDFNGDGYGDLAVGVLWEDLESPQAVENAGAVHVLYGSSDGLDTTDSQVWYEGVNGVHGPALANDQFGQALVAGDFNGDGHDDLVIGVPLNDMGGRPDSGLVHVLYGSAAGLSGNSDEVWYQGWLGGLEDIYEAGDHFGQALATGDMNRDGYDDLAVGVPYKDSDDPVAANAGAVHFIFGSAGGLASDGNFLLFQPAAGPMAPEADDNLGMSLACGDFDGNGFADIAAGVPGEEDNPAKSNAGAVMVVYFPDTPVVITMWDQDDTGVQDIAEAGDGFGTSLAAGDFDGNGYADLAVGVPWEDILSPVVTDAGAVQVLYGSAAGIVGGNDDFWHQTISGIGDWSDAEDRFGLSLAASLTLRHKIYLPVVLRHS